MNYVEGSFTDDAIIQLANRIQQWRDKGKFNYSCAIKGHQTASNLF